MRCSLTEYLRPLLLLLWWVPLQAAPLQWPATDATVAETAELIRYVVAINGAERVDGVTLALPDQVSRYYWQRGFRPAWFDRDGIFIEAGELLHVLRQAEAEGLPVGDYPIAAIEQRLFGPIDDIQHLAQLDLLLTDAFLHYSLNVYSGRIDPRRAGSDWFIPYVPLDPAALLPQVLAQRNLAAVLAGLPPQYEGYRRLRLALQQYRAVAAQGGWPEVAGGEILRFGAREPRVAQLRRRLWLSGDLAAAEAAEPELYDNTVRRAVRRFQRRHGLQADGSVGDATLAALNVPVEQRILQIAANMDRWRWLPRQMEPRHILVNMAGYDLQLVEDGQVVLDMRVIVGRDYRQTPVFTSTMTSLVLNPYWYVPRTIFRDDILPRLRRDPGYLQRAGMRLFSSLDGNGSQVDAAAIDWERVDGDRFPYSLRQDPGPHNALGRIKFLLPNRYGIFLHDTPDRSLFNLPARAFSSGCIRLEDPVELARRLLADEARWSRARLEEAIAAGKPLGLTLPAPVPVYLVYWTAWVDGEGALHLRDDIYGRDARLLELWQQNATTIVATEPANP
ncbi:L,D-transpeptidase family protein [Sulfurivermis fontis]|uniref:L,D-transpeptidase family protein n=1 Tax=Sulfurivermis fontis TaxID=1972068 RepID=UPI0011AE9D78|nr:L,D-transpeptidase family protein [Sulfurivermis fontis]